MKALTILQPWAELIARGAKRVENRSWRTNYRGSLAIHAGLSPRLMDAHGYLLGAAADDNCDFGAVIAVCELVECTQIDNVASPSLYGPSLCWVRHDPFAEGPICWILADVRRLSEPIRCSGQRGLWTPDAKTEAALGCSEKSPR